MKPINISLEKNLASYLEEYQPDIHEFCLANFYIWSHIDHPELKFVNDNLCIFIRSSINLPYFLEPIGNKNLDDTVSNCLQSGYSMRVSERFLKKINLSSKYQISELRDEFDYVYKTEILADLKGTKFHAKRNHIARFKREFPKFKCLPIKSLSKEAALKIFEKWAIFHKANNNNNNAKYITIDMQKNALVNAFDYIDCCNIWGVYIEVSDLAVGFILGSPLNQNTFVIHVEYALPDIPGIYQMLLQQICLELKAKFSYINLEQDLGILGLRKMKLSYYPDHLQKKYEIKLI